VQTNKRLRSDATAAGGDAGNDGHGRLRVHGRSGEQRGMWRAIGSTNSIASTDPIQSTSTSHNGATLKFTAYAAVHHPVHLVFGVAESGCVDEKGTSKWGIFATSDPPRVRHYASTSGLPPLFMPFSTAKGEIRRAKRGAPAIRIRRQMEQLGHRRTALAPAKPPEITFQQSSRALSTPVEIK
jgi:hypothetical protein